MGILTGGKDEGDTDDFGVGGPAHCESEVSGRAD